MEGIHRPVHHRLLAVFQHLGKSLGTYPVVQHVLIRIEGIAVFQVGILRSLQPHGQHRGIAPMFQRRFEVHLAGADHLAVRGAEGHVQTGIAILDQAQGRLPIRPIRRIEQRYLRRNAAQIGYRDAQYGVLEDRRTAAVPGRRQGERIGEGSVTLQERFRDDGIALYGLHQGIQFGRSGFLLGRLGGLLLGQTFGLGQSLGLFFGRRRGKPHVPHEENRQ